MFQHGGTLLVSEPPPFLSEADALADAVLEMLPTIREVIIERVPARARPMPALDHINEALMRYLRVRRSR